MEAPWAPFCSQRCKDVDLGQWLRGDYRIPADRPPDDEDSPDPPDDPGDTQQRS